MLRQKWARRRPATLVYFKRHLQDLHVYFTVSHWVFRCLRIWETTRITLISPQHKYLTIHWWSWNFCSVGRIPFLWWCSGVKHQTTFWVHPARNPVQKLSWDRALHTTAARPSRAAVIAPMPSWYQNSRVSVMWLTTRAHPLWFEWIQNTVMTWKNPAWICEYKIPQEDTRGKYTTKVCKTCP